jgi:hypothetical protein
VNDLERCMEYDLGCGPYPVCGMGLWMSWKGTSCTNGIVNGVDRCPEYGFLDDF